MTSIERLQALSAQTTFRPETIERVVRLLDVLENFARDPFLGPRFALKGGTALNLFHLDLDRLSVDIDLNYVGAADVEAMLEDKAQADAYIPDMMARLGYRSQRAPSKDHAGGKWVYRYTSAQGSQGTLEVDVNYLYRVPFFGTQTLSSTTLDRYRASDVTVVHLDEIAAGKLVALVSRRASRDLYDTWRLLDRKDLDWGRIKAATLAIGASARDLDWRVASLDGYAYDLNELQSKLLGVVRKSTLSEFGGAGEWCEMVLERCRDRLRPLFAFTDGERAFLDALYDEGRIDTSGLDVAEDVRSRIELFPALRWKAQNIRSHLSAGPGPR